MFSGSARPNVASNIKGYQGFLGPDMAYCAASSQPFLYRLMHAGYSGAAGARIETASSPDALSKCPKQSS